MGRVSERPTERRGVGSKSGAQDARHDDRTASVDSKRFRYTIRLTTTIFAFIIRADGGPDHERRRCLSYRRNVPRLLSRVLHRLDDGSEWEQVGKVEEYVYRERPGLPDRIRPRAALDRRGGDERGCRGETVCGETVGGCRCVLITSGRRRNPDRGVGKTSGPEPVVSRHLPTSRDRSSRRSTP